MLDANKSVLQHGHPSGVAAVLPVVPNLAPEFVDFASVALVIGGAAARGMALVTEEAVCLEAVHGSLDTGGLVEVVEAVGLRQLARAVVRNSCPLHVGICPDAQGYDGHHKHACLQAAGTKAADAAAGRVTSSTLV